MIRFFIFMAVEKGMKSVSSDFHWVSAVDRHLSSASFYRFYANDRRLSAVICERKWEKNCKHLESLYLTLALSLACASSYILLLWMIVIGDHEMSFMQSERTFHQNGPRCEKTRFNCKPKHRRRSDCAYAQSDLRLCFASSGKYYSLTWYAKVQNSNTLN